MKKPYNVPQLFQVDLMHEQAILSACSLTAVNPQTGGLDLACRPRGCKKDKDPRKGDSGMRPS